MSLYIVALKLGADVRVHVVLLAIAVYSVMMPSVTCGPYLPLPLTDIDTDAFEDELGRVQGVDRGGLICRDESALLRISR